MMQERKQEFRRNERLEKLLGELNALLAPAQDVDLAGHRMPRWPVVLIVGCPRSGTTLSLQWLAGTGAFGYPTNFLARFYAAPAIGARIQRMLVDPEFDFRGELLADSESPDAGYSSKLGKTRGLLAPHEFWYFWRRFFHFGEIQQLDETTVRQVDGRRFAAELAAMEAVLDKPLALKAMILEWNLPLLDRLLENALFLHIKRKPFFNAQSLYESRLAFSGDPTRWYSFKPPEYSQLRDRPPEEQVAGQVHFTNRAIEEGLRQVDPGRRLEVTYEKLCEQPAVVYRDLAERLQAQGCSPLDPYTGPDRFRCTNQTRVYPELAERIDLAVNHYAD